MKEGEGEKEKKAQAFQGYLRDASCLGLRGFAVLNGKIVFILRCKNILRTLKHLKIELLVFLEYYSYLTTFLCINTFCKHLKSIL